MDVSSLSDEELGQLIRQSIANGATLHWTSPVKSLTEEQRLAQLERKRLHDEYYDAMEERLHAWSLQQWRDLWIVEQLKGTEAWEQYAVMAALLNDDDLHEQHKRDYGYGTEDYEVPYACYTDSDQPSFQDWLKEKEGEQ